MARGVADVDPLAGELLDGPLGLVVRAARGRPLRTAAVNVATFGLVDHAALRTQAIDAAVHEAVGAGLRQVALLGAGLDARAWRMPDLADVSVFEVDHPATQRYKRSRVGNRPARARDVRFVPIDFGRDSLADVLARAGHDAGSPTFWLWEGVTPYLTIDAVRATLESIAARSAPGSRIAVTYATPRAAPLGASFTRVALLGFRLVGEPAVGLIEPGAMRAELARAGYRVLEDTASPEWADRYGGGGKRLLLVPERLAVAERSSRR